MTRVLTKKIWYLDFDGKVEGPFSFEELKSDRRLSPDTLVWRAGFEKWVPIKAVPELQDIFKDEESEGEDEEIEEEIEPVPDEEIALKLDRYEPPFFFYWLLLIAAILIFIVYRLLDR